MAIEKKYNNLDSFYLYYLCEHKSSINRFLHFIGTALVIFFLVVGVVKMDWHFLVAIPFLGYGFAWIGHFFIEKNKPATFTYPLYSLASDFIMFWHIITGQINKKLEEATKGLKK
ncbi:MAG: DUF962 domain-containing protein [Lysobacteraceae bacterium]|nr:DUF962 domain-containing protein [Ferruginibacter sp.]